MTIDSRVYLFLGCAAACFFLAPVAPGSALYVACGLGVTYAVFAVAVFADSMSRRNTKPLRHRDRVRESQEVTQEVAQKAGG